MKKSKREFKPNRLYKLAKIIVVGISVTCGAYALWALQQIESNTILHSWEQYCEKQPDTKEFLQIGYSCMGVGLEQINNISSLMYKTGAIAILLPTIFFGGVGLYRYLFPKSAIKHEGVSEK